MIDYFEHQPITDKWVDCVASAHAHAETIETIIVCGFFGVKEYFRANDTQVRDFLTQATRWLSQFKTPC